MAQIFHRSTNFIARFSVFSALFLVGIALVAVLAVARSPYMTRQNITREQPVQFSHKHHVGDDGIDCRYCHTGVETSAVAGIPPTKTVIVGRGWTQPGGRPHAESEALTRAGEATVGATLYVTLEPCSHVGKTPACAD